jgi:hypothetical protein
MPNPTAYGTIVRVVVTMFLSGFGTFLTGYSWVEGRILGVVVGLSLLGLAVTVAVPSRR